jgi:SAM-dependent methyltransferase
MNTILTDKQRDAHKDVITELFKLCPATMSRKIARANVQQAFVLDMVRKLSTTSSKLLSVGAYEDTASESLIKLGYQVKEIDPAINMDLNTFFHSTQEKYDTILSTSVIEHVEDDGLFIDQICQLLKPGGHAVITCDFRDDYKPGNPKPHEDYRLYTKHDLLIRFKNILDKNGCVLQGAPDYDYAPDFQYQVYWYSFATYVFKKAQ